MKLNVYCLPTVVLCGAVLGASADEPKGIGAKSPSRTNLTWSHSGSARALGHVVPAGKLIGAEVKNRQDENLGEIDELAVDLPAGRVVQVILSPGLFGRDVVVPPSAFTCEPSAGDASVPRVRLNVDRAKLKGSPPFDQARWSEAFQAHPVAESYRYFGVPPYFTTVEGNVRTGVYRTNYWDRLGRVDKASKVIGMTVKNPQGESVGKVDDLLIDLAAGRVVQVIVSAGGFLGIGDVLHAVPPAAFGRDAGQENLVLNVTKERLMSAPRHRRDELWNSGDRVWALDTYRYYQVTPYFDAGVEADNSKRNVADRDPRSLTPFDQGTSEADVETTRNIRRAIRDHETLSVDAQNVKVITRDGRVTLRGPVESNHEKEVLAVIALRYAATARNLDNQLEVKRPQGRE